VKSNIVTNRMLLIYTRLAHKTGVECNVGKGGG